MDESRDLRLMEHWEVPIAGPEAPSEILTFDDEFSPNDGTSARTGETQELGGS